jgi:hypothetical protein
MATSLLCCTSPSVRMQVSRGALMIAAVTIAVSPCSALRAMTLATSVQRYSSCTKYMKRSSVAASVHLAICCAALRDALKARSIRGASASSTSVHVAQLCACVFTSELLLCHSTVM